MSDQKAKINYFVRFLISVLCIMLAAMALYKFFNIDPRGTIDSGTIFIIMILVVLVLSEAFDNFSIFKLISVSRKVEEKEVKIKDLEKKNEALLSQVISMCSVQNQNQNLSHLNVYGDYHVVPPKVTPATQDEIDQKTSNEDEVSQTKSDGGSEDLENNTNDQPSRKYFSSRIIERVAMAKYLHQKSLSPLNVVADAKLMSNFGGIDPIANQRVIFDGYYRENNKEIFMEFKQDRSNLATRDRLYVMLSKVNHYRIANNVNAHLDLIIVRTPAEFSRRLSFLNALPDFAPAIATGLLKVIEMNVSEDEYDEAKAEDEKDEIKMDVKY